MCAVIAFPLGATLPEDKAYEARRVIDNGATEVDMVINLGALKSESYGLILNDILFVTQEAHARGAKVKVIIEAALLTRREKILACLLAQAAGADFVKTSTGFGRCGPDAASGGNRDRRQGGWWNPHISRYPGDDHGRCKSHRSECRCFNRK